MLQHLASGLKIVFHYRCSKSQSSRYVLPSLNKHSIFLKKKILTHPQVVHNLYCLLEFYRNVYWKILVKTRTYRKILRKRWPVIFSTCKRENKEKKRRPLYCLLERDIHFIYIWIFWNCLMHEFLKWMDNLGYQNPRVYEQSST